MDLQSNQQPVQQYQQPQSAPSSQPKKKYGFLIFTIIALILASIVAGYFVIANLLKTPEQQHVRCKEFNTVGGIPKYKTSCIFIF